MDSELATPCLNNDGCTSNTTESTSIYGSTVSSTSTTSNVTQNLCNVDFKPSEEETKYPEDFDASCENNSVPVCSTIVPRLVEQSGVIPINNMKAASVEAEQQPSPEVLGNDTAERPLTRTEKCEDAAVKDETRTGGSTDRPGNNAKQGKTSCPSSEGYNFI